MRSGGRDEYSERCRRCCTAGFGTAHRQRRVPRTLNRPAQYNALSEEMLAALEATLNALNSNASVRVVVLGGAGKAFCAGHDLKQDEGPS